MENLLELIHLGHCSTVSSLLSSPCRPHASCCPTASSAGAWWHQKQLPRWLWWSIVDAEVFWGCAFPCLGWKNGFAEHGVRTWYNATGCSWGLFVLLLTRAMGACCGKTFLPLACQPS